MFGGSNTPAYAELQVTTNFSFLRGGSHPHELVVAAAEQGLAAIAVADRNTLAGVVRAHLAAKECGLKLIVGARLDLEDAPSLLCFPTDRQAYGRLARLLSLGQSRAEKGACHLYLDDVAAPWRRPDLCRAGAARLELARGLAGGAAIGGSHASRMRRRSSRSMRRARSAQRPERTAPTGADAIASKRICNRLKKALGMAPLYLAASHLYRGDDQARIGALARLAERCHTPLVATNDVLYHAPSRRPLQDVLTCIREKTTIDKAGFLLEANGERHVKAPAAMAAPVPRPRGCAAPGRSRSPGRAGFHSTNSPTSIPMSRCRRGIHRSPISRRSAWRGSGLGDFRMVCRPRSRDALEKELALIAQLEYAPYFLTVYDIVHFRPRPGHPVPGSRGSAANSVVCYCLAITAVNPTEVDLLFERFVSPERREPPDIDVDFEHERREEVMQYHLCPKYGPRPRRPGRNRHHLSHPVGGA